MLNPFFLWQIDETSWKSLSGVRANKCILQLVPSLEVIEIQQCLDSSSLSQHYCYRPCQLLFMEYLLLTLAIPIIVAVCQIMGKEARCIR